MRTSGWRPYVLLTGAALIVFSCVLAGAAEVQLGGVRLNEPVMNLLTRPGWGQPEGIGPLAALSLAQASGTVAGPGQMGSGMSEQGMGGGMDMFGGMGPGTGRMGYQGMQRQGAAVGGAAAKGELRGTTGPQFWLYLRQSGVRLILGVEPSGRIATITALGSYSPEIYTSRGIGLGDTYFALIGAYGYPDLTQPTGEGLEITYPDQDVRFALKNLRITEIAIGQPPAPAQTPAQQFTGAGLPGMGPGAMGSGAEQGMGGGGMYGMPGQMGRYGRMGQ